MREVTCLFNLFCFFDVYRIAVTGVANGLETRTDAIRDKSTKTCNMIQLNKPLLLSMY